VDELQVIEVVYKNKKPIWAFYFLCYNFKKIIKMEGYDGV